MFIIESTDGRVLRASDVGLVLGGSDPHKYQDEKLAQQVANTVMGILGSHNINIKLHVRREDHP